MPLRRNMSFYWFVSPYVCTPFAVQYEKVQIHLREKSNNCVKLHSFATKTDHLQTIERILHSIFINKVALSTRLFSTSGLFLSAQRGLASFTPNSIPSNVLATVRSWISGLSGSRLLSSLFIRARVSRQFSLMISSWQSLISSSTRTLFLPPRGLPWILPSLM